jgi:hypothetical protein
MGILLPEEGLFTPEKQWARLVQEGLRSGHWYRIDKPADLAVALVRFPDRPSKWHIGLLGEDNPWQFVSTAAGMVVSQRLSLYIDAGIIRGFYAYRPQRSGRRRGGVHRSTSTPR